MTGGRGALIGGPSLGERRLAEETRERFLREIVARVPLDRLAAVHLFRPIRQGGFESGVAVIAAEPPAPGADAIAEPACDPTDAAAGAAPTGGAAVERSTEVAMESEAESSAMPGAEPGAEGAESRAENAEPVAEARTEPLSEETDVDAPAPEPAAPEPAAPELPGPEPRPTRHTVFTARYRLAIKGPDRGKWDVEVVEEADAPMVTVEAVVRGVQRRAGDEADPERLDAAAVSHLLRADAPAPRTAAGASPP